jgi:hypothetical protein
MTFQSRRLPLWFGRFPRRSLGFLVLAIFLFVCLFVLHAPPTASKLSSLGIPTGFGVNFPILLVLMLIPAALNAYANDGILISIVLAASPLFGAFLGIMLFTSPPFRPNPTTILQTTLPFMAIAIGLAAGLGCALGIGIRRIST